jgi:hypothetical protein
MPRADLLRNIGAPPKREPIGAPPPGTVDITILDPGGYLATKYLDDNFVSALSAP